MKIIGSILIAVGILGFLSAMNMDTTVAITKPTLNSGEFTSPLLPDRVHNYGLMLNCLGWLIISAAVFISGVLFYGFGNLSEPALPNEQTLPDEQTSESKLLEPPSKRGVAAFFTSE